MRQRANFRFIAVAISILIAIPHRAAAQTADTHARIVDLFQQAQQAEQAEDLSKAAGFYRDIVAIDPSIAEVWSNLGMALYRQDRYKESVAAFERAATLKPALLTPHLFAGLSYQKMGETAKALGPLKAALAIEPNQPEATIALSEVYAQTGQFEASVRLLQKALKRDPDSESLGSDLAVTYLDWAKDVGTTLRRSPSLYGRLISDMIHAATGATIAEEHFRATVDFAPGSVEARLALARFLMEGQATAERLRASAEQIEAARKISPGDPEVDAEEVRLAGAQQDTPRASALLLKAMQEDPGYVLANLNSLEAGLTPESLPGIKEQAESMAARSTGCPNSYSSKYAAMNRIRSKRPLTAAEDTEFASAAWRLHRYEEALSELVSRHRSDPQSQYWIFRACKALGGEVLKQTVNAHPDSVPSHLLLADFAIQHEDYKEAKSEYQTAMALRPHDPEIRLLNVRLFETAGETHEAQEKATLDAAEFPSDPGLNFEAGELMLRSAGDAEAAVKFLERALQSDSEMVRARVDLADAYAQLQRLDDAIREVNRVAGTDDDGTLHYRLARWYRQTGHAEEAAKALAFCKQIKERRIENDTFVPIARSDETNHDPLQR